MTTQGTALVQKSYIPFEACTQPAGDNNLPPKHVVTTNGLELPDGRSIGVEYRVQSLEDDFPLELIQDLLEERFQALAIQKTAIPTEYSETWGPIAGWEIAERINRTVTAPLINAGIIFRRFDEMGLVRCQVSADIGVIDRAVLPYRMYFTKRNADKETLDALTSGIIAQQGFNPATFDLALFLRKYPERLREFYAQESAGQRRAILASYTGIAHIARAVFTPVFDTIPGLATRMQLFADNHPLAISAYEIEAILNEKTAIPLETRLSTTTIAQLTPRVDHNAQLYLASRPLS